MLDPQVCVKYYAQRWVQDTIAQESKDKEVGVRLGDKGFGKRPDTIRYAQDVLEFAKQGVTSFHVSEELWHNPLHLSAEMRKLDMERLRKGWDLVLNIDCPHWELAKAITHAITCALLDHGIQNVSVKFSGNKGFHIGVPFESFPEKIGDQKTEAWFPEGPRRIAEYLIDYISKKYVTVSKDALAFSQAGTFSMAELGLIFEGKKLTLTRCQKCGKEREKKNTRVEFICPKCDHRVQGTEEEIYRNCPKCGNYMEKSTMRQKCTCGSTAFHEVFDPKSVLEVDTILISPRHLYRSSYSLHEKSGGVSLPLQINQILLFEKKEADVTLVRAADMKFLERKKSVPGEAMMLFREAFDFTESKSKTEFTPDPENDKKWEDLQEAIPEQFFPPCIQHILSGLKDGKKRALFILVNFLIMAGWDYEMVEKRVREWNMKNFEPLREQVFVSHIRYHKQQGKKVLPPNCSNQMYYVGIGVCHPNELCRKIKNPVNYARLKAKMAQEVSKKRKPKKIEPKPAVHKSVQKPATS